MDWNSCLFCAESKIEELRGRVKTSSKEKADKEKERIEETYKKIASLIHQLAKEELFSIEKFSCDNNEQTLFEKFKKNNAVYHHNCVSNNQQKLKRFLDKRKRDDDKQKEANKNKRSKRSDVKEPPSVTLGEFKCLFCGVTDDVSNLCAGGTQHATSKKINEAKNRSFSENLWHQASKLQDSRVLSFLSLGTAAAREMNYHRACLTEFHNRYRSLMTAEAREQSFDSYKAELNFHKIVNHVLDQRRLGVTVFRVTELEKIYTELLHEDCIEYTPHVTRFAQRLQVELGPFFYNDNGVEIRTIGKFLSLCFSGDVDEIISNELQNPATFVTSLVGLVSPIRQAMSKVSNTFNNSFPPDCQIDSVPIQLQVLCSVLIDGCDPRVKGFSQSSKTIAQLIMYQYRKMTGHSSSVTSLHRHVKERETPVPVYVGLKLYASLRTKTVIQHFFSLGLSISYDRCLSICNNISLNMLKKYDLEGVFVASHLTLGTFTIIAKDNVDLNARSTKVKKHFHGISMTTMQFPSKQNQGMKQNIIYDLSLLDNSKKLTLPEDYEIIRELPLRKNVPLSLPVCTINIEYLNYQDTLYKIEFDKEIAWLKSFDSKNLPWASYHSNNSIYDNSDCVPGRHSLMPLINEKVDTLNSQYHCMNIIKKTINFTNKDQVPIDVSDQPVYAISKEIQIRYPLEFGPDKYICSLGDLHLEHTGLLVHGELIRGSGLDTLFLYSKLSTDGASAVVDVIDIKRSRYCLQVSVVVIYTLLKKAYIKSESTLSILDWLDEAAKHSQMCFYWRMILNFEVLLLVYLRSIREGNFPLYLASLYRMLPWFFALDRYNYARWATIHWFDMELLKHRCPKEYEEFSAGNFSFLKNNKQFSRMALDQLHEQNNKYIKSVSGATSLINRQDDSALVRWELCGPELCRIIKDFEEVEASTTNERKQKHHEDSPTFTKDFIKDTTILLDNFTNNPFLLNDLTVINNTDMVFEDNIYHNLTQLLKTGENQLHSFIEDRLIMSKQPISAKIMLNHFQLPGFKKSTEKQSSSGDKRLSPTFITKLRSAITYRREHAKLLFSSEIYDYCQSLSENGSDLYHGVKSNILNRFEHVTNRIEISSSAALLIELSPLFRSDTHTGTFEEFARRLFDKIEKMANGYSRVDIICDRYFNNSLKNLTRKGRGNGPKLLFYDDTPLPSKFNDSFLKNNDNKERLNLYCADKFQSYQGPSQSLNITKGEFVLSNSTLDASISINTAEEADQKLVRHMIECVRSGMKQCVVRTVDTDVVISLIAYRMLAGNFDCEVFACLSSAALNRYYNINKIAGELGERRCRALPFFYALTGCDIVSSFFNQGKCKFWDRWIESPEEEALTNVFMELSEKPITVTEEKISVIERFIGFVYYGRRIESIDSERMRDFEYSLHGNLRLIPPSRSGLKEHIRRAAYYAGWVNFQCVENVSLPSPSDWGWRFSNGLFTPLWHSSEVTITADSLTATCGCSSQKCIKCKCIRFSCIPFCKCQRNCVYKSV